MTQIKFGTDGWRAIIGQDYTYENVGLVLQGFCDVQASLGKTGVVIIGYDRRFCGKQFAEHAAEVLLANGFEVWLSQDYCPTPGVSWMVKHNNALAGVVITASHNPFQWNGVKFKEGYGGSASPEYCKKIEEQIIANQQKKVKWVTMQAGLENGKLKYFDPNEAYLNQLASFVDIALIKKAKLKIVVDSLYGAGAGFIKKILGDQILEIRNENNPGFNGINPEPIDKNMQLTFETVLKNKADLALVTDGDADRIGAVDEQGVYVNSHQIFSLLLRHLVQVKKLRGDVVKTVSTTQMVTNMAKKFELPLHETPIGFKFICEKFLATQPLIGGEESGGIGVAAHVYERDGLLNGLLLAEIVAHHGKPLSQIIADLQKDYGPLFFQRQDVHLAQDKIKQLAEKLTQNPPQRIGEMVVRQTNFMDGFKFMFDDGAWLLIRPSGTEPLLRVYAETPNAQQTTVLLKNGLAII